MQSLQRIIQDFREEGHPLRTLYRKIWVNIKHHGLERWAVKDFMDFPLLNVGCGDDYIEGAMNIDNGQLETYTKRKVKADLICSASRLPFKDEVFQTVFASHVLEHQKYMDVAIREWQRVLKVGGRLVVVVPNIEYLGKQAYFRDPTHIHALTPNYLEWLFQVIDGWKIIQFNKCSPFFKFSIDIVAEKIH